ncbi:site-specific integrase [Pedobacter jeongneungensis]|uniref:site-specific integrase n=1 Tax=Pedobacter jeongneungensis TaxID=947309 RepID=UPI0004691916|nr:site-specific integrase [Pedobacter jeongneungensis]
MLEKSFGLLYYLKKPKNQKKKDRYVYLRVTVDGKSKEVSTKRMWLCDKWNQHTGRALGNKEDARSLNDYLESLTGKIYDAKKLLVDTNRRMTALGIINIISGNGPEHRMIIDIFKKHNEIVEKLIGEEYKPRTLQRYTTACTHLKNFIVFKSGVLLDKIDMVRRQAQIDGIDMELQDINYEFVLEFYYWLRSEKKHSYNSAVKYLSLFKRIIIQCRKKGWLFADPFADFKTSPKDIPVVPLTQSELQRLRTKIFSTKRLDTVRDIFVFSCYTGLAYVDIKNLQRFQIITDEEGNKWIISNREKNGAPIKVPMLRIAEQLLDKYADYPKCLQTGCAMPVSSNQKMNEYLKEIAALCDIDRNLTYHIARHTFATTVTLSNGVPIETVSKLMGHATIKQTQHYAKVIDTKALEDMEKLEKRLAAKPQQEPEPLPELDISGVVAQAS